MLQASLSSRAFTEGISGGNSFCLLRKRCITDILQSAASRAIKKQQPGREQDTCYFCVLRNRQCHAKTNQSCGLTSTYPREMCECIIPALSPLPAHAAKPRRVPHQSPAMRAVKDCAGEQLNTRMESPLNKGRRRTAWQFLAFPPNTRYNATLGERSSEGETQQLAALCDTAASTRWHRLKFLMKSFNHLGKGVCLGVFEGRKWFHWILCPYYTGRDPP